MEKEQIKQEILSLISKEIDQWLEAQATIKDGHEYEEKFMSISQKVSKILLSQSVGTLPKNRNKKKLQTCFGKIEMSKTHPIAQHTSHFGISSKLQELLCLVGQAYVFEEGSEILDKTLGINISAKQIQRVSEYYGQALEYQQEQYINEEKEAPVLPISSEEELIYVMMDGSMVYTREEEWKEMKVGRIFSGSDCVPIQKKRNQIIQSMYVCHLGNHKDFFAKFEAYIRLYKNKVCIADGAKWLWNWIEDNYPDIVQILDFYHAIEKLAFYASNQYNDKEERKKWMEIQKQQLLNNKVKTVISQLLKVTAISKEAEKARTDVIRYYQNNIMRMQYKTYIEKGYLIGSGAIESAHRNVVQQRLKLSGQRWSMKGAQQIVNLRAYKKSNRWADVVDIIKLAA